MSSSDVAHPSVENGKLIARRSKGNPDPAKVLARTARCIELLLKEGLPFDALQIPINDLSHRRNLVRVWQDLATARGHAIEGVGDDESCVRELFAFARGALGDDFLDPDTISGARGYLYDQEQLAKLAESLPSEEVLRELQRDGLVLIAGPPKPLSIIDMINDSPEFRGHSEWVEDSDQLFSREDKVYPGWIALYKQAIPLPPTDRSIGEFVPNAAVVFWCVSAYCEAADELLFRYGGAGSSSEAANGHPVSISGGSLIMRSRKEISGFVVAKGCS